MKTPALKRILALLMAVISVSLLVSGILGMRAATKARRSGDEEIVALQNRIDDYRNIRANLMDTGSYDSMNSALEQRKREYESESAHHRTELATYTATNGGLEAGAKAMSQAEAVLAMGKTQYESGKAQMEKQAAAFESVIQIAETGKTMLGGILPVLDAVEIALNSADQLLDRLRRIGDMMALPGGDNIDVMRETTVEAADAALDAYAAAETVTELLRDQVISAETLREMLQSFGIYSEEDLLRILEESGLELTEEQRQAVTTLMSAEQVIPLSSEQIDEIRSEVEQNIGMSMDELVTKIRIRRDAVQAGEEDYDINGEQFGTIRRAYTDNRESIERMSFLLETVIPTYRETVTSAKEKLREAENSLGQIDAAKAAIEEGYAMLEAAGEQIAAGEAALAQGSAQLETARENQKTKAEELDREKQSLDRQEKELKQAEEETEKQKQLETQEKGLRSALLSKEEILKHVQAGEDLLTASENWLEKLEKQTEDSYRDRFDAGILMIVSAVLALTAAVASLGGRGNRAVSLLSTLLCQAFSLSAVLILFRMGRGISWSALASTVLAAGLLACLVPELMSAKR